MLSHAVIVCVWEADSSKEGLVNVCVIGPSRGQGPGLVVWPFSEAFFSEEIRHCGRSEITGWQRNSSSYAVAW